MLGAGAVGSASILGAAAPEQLSALWEEFKRKGNVGKREGS